MSTRDVVSKFAISVCIALTASSAFAQPTASVSAVPPGASQPAAAPDQAYILGPDDVIEIEVLGRSDFRTRARIGTDGKILLPYIGELVAANKTTRQIGEEIAQALENGGYFAKPVMRVEIASYASRYVIVLGAVGAPGLVPVNRNYRLSEIVARVGGIRGDGADYIVIRPAEGPEKRILVKDMAMGGVAEDPYVSPADKIYVPTADLFYISGQVRAPGTFPVGSDMTFRQAIARAGGLTEMGTERRLKVTRGGKEVKVELDGKVLAGDIVVIGERLF